MNIGQSGSNNYVLSAIWGLANEATAFYKRLVSLLSSKWDTPYSATMSWLRCQLSFSLLHSAILYIRAACSTTGHDVKSSYLPPVNLVNTQSYIHLTDWFLLLYLYMTSTLTDFVNLLTTLVAIWFTLLYIINNNNYYARCND